MGERRRQYRTGALTTDISMLGSRVNNLAHENA